MGDTERHATETVVGKQHREEGKDGKCTERGQRNRTKIQHEIKQKRRNGFFFYVEYIYGFVMLGGL